MLVATILKRNVLKSVGSAKCISWCSNYVKNSTQQSVNRLYLCLTNKLPVVTTTNTYFQCRFKYDKSSRKKDDGEIDESTKNEFDETLDGKDNKVATVRVNSMRMDLLVKAGLGLARNKVENAFYESRIRVNGQKVQKKSVSLHIGDELDVIKGVSPMNNEHLIVSRIEILAATANEEDISLAIRKFKNLTIENYSGQNIYKSSDN